MVQKIYIVEMSVAARYLGIYLKNLPLKSLTIKLINLIFELHCDLQHIIFLPGQTLDPLKCTLTLSAMVGGIL